MVSVGEQQLCTLPHVGGGRNPTWQQAVHFSATGAEREAIVDIKVGCTFWLGKCHWAESGACRTPETCTCLASIRSHTVKVCSANNNALLTHTPVTPSLRFREHRVRLRP